MRLVFLTFLVLIPNYNKHKFYISNTSIKFIPKTRSLQITTQIFANDLEATINKKTKGIKLNPDNNIELADSLTREYFKKNLVFKNQNEIIDCDFLGKIYRNDLLVCYLEIKLDNYIKSIEVKNTLLFDFSNDQKNILHFLSEGRRRSFLSVSSDYIFNFKLDLNEE